MFGYSDLSGCRDEMLKLGRFILASWASLKKHCRHDEAMC